MKNNASFVYSFFLLIGDFLALIAAFVGAYLLRVTWADKAVAHPVSAINYFWLFVTLAPFWLLILPCWASTTVISTNTASVSLVAC